MTTLSTEIRENDVLRLENNLHKVIAANIHTGGGKTGAMVHLKLRHLATGHVTERRFATTEKVERLDIERLEMQYLYGDGDTLYFMNPANYEQLSLKKHSVGGAALFLKEESRVQVELYEGAPLAINFPIVVEVVVASTGAGLRGQGDSTYKEAVLDNGLTVLVPQFIKEGDAIRVEVETQRYLERVRKETTKT